MSTNYHSLAGGSLTQNWSNSALVTTNDDWSAVPSIQGYLGDVDAGSPTEVDPRTITAAALGAVDVIANQANPNTLATGGVAEFTLADPTVALNGSGTADAPSLVVYLDASGQQDVRVQFNVRDLDASADDAIQQVAVQYRLGDSGAWTNVTGGYISDATTAGTATQVTAIDVTLPAAANNQAQVQVRILTTNAIGADEWVGIDDINVSSAPFAGGDTTPPALLSSSPADDAGNVAPAADIVLTFNETVQAGSGNITITDGAGDVRVIAITDPQVAISGNTVTINPTADLAVATSYDVIIDAGAIEDTSGNAFPGIAANTLDFTTISTTTAISTVQGTGASSTLVGQTVMIEAIVVGDFQNGDADAKRSLNGFYLQEEITDQDGNALSSEGVFVFLGSLAGVADVAVGDRVSVVGTVNEFNGSTQITASSVSLIEAGAVEDIDTLAVDIDLPSASVIQRPGTVANSTTSFYADLEAYEGMLVSFPETLTITEQFNLDQFVEVRLTAGDRPVTFTHENEPDVAGSIANLQDIASRTIVYDDGLNVSNTPIGNLDGFGPAYGTANAPRMGDTVDNLTGVIDFAFNAYRLRSVEDGANVFADTNPRQAAPDDVGGTLKVASFNVLNFFRTLDDGSLTANGLEPRGANTAAEFERQVDKLVGVLQTIDADVLGLIELENNFLPGASGNAIEFLVNELNAEVGAGTYAWVNPGQQFVGGDAIAVGFIYKPSVVQISLDSTIQILDDSDLPGLGLGNLITDSTVDGVFNGVNTSRAALAVTFEEVETGGEFTAVVNHFKSKSGIGTGNDADALDGQGNWQQQREFAATALAEWIETDPTGSSDEDFLIIGDLNAYFKEDTIDILAGAGFENLQAALSDPYSFVFDGQAGALDYILANGSMSSQVTGVTEWHINSDEADALDYNLDFGRDPAIFDEDIAARVSDHDPLIIGLDLTEEPPVANFTLQLLHLSDGEAGLLASDTAPNLAALVDAFDDDYANTLILSGGDNWLPGPFLAAGTDLSVTSTLNAVSGSTIGATANIPIGAVDIAIHNAMGVEVSSIGNHEFDLGSRVFRDSFSPNLGAAGWVGADFVHLSANLDFSGDADLNPRFTNTLDGGTGTLVAEASTLKGRIAPAVVVTEGGQKIGFVGVTTQILESISSPSGTEVKGFPTGPGPNGEIDDMDLLAAQIQPIIDELIAEGVNKIILHAHLQQIGNEKLLATKLHGVDIILSAGSNTRLGDADDEAVAFPGHAADFADTYPLQILDADGKTTLIVNTDNEYTYMGRLVVEFDENGDIVLDSLTANQSINGAYASTAENVAEAWGTTVDNLANTAFADGTKGDKVEKLVGAVDDVIEIKDGNVFGFTDVYLEGERQFVRSQETNLGDLSADANAWVADQALGDVPFLVSLKNGGGIRAQIGTISPPGPDGSVDKLPPPANPDVGKPEGGVSQLDIENSLRFDNKLMVFDTTAQGLLNILNWGAGLPANNGGFPQIGGVKFSFDPDLPGNVGSTPGSRIRDVALIDENGNVVAMIVDDGVVLPGAPAVISVVTLNFTANGGDGYPVKANGENFRYLLNDGTLSAPVSEALDFTAPANVPANALGEQQAFADYMAEFHATQETAYDQADTPISEDTRIQNLNFRDDTVFDSAPIFGDDNDNVINGTAGNDTIDGRDGDDRIFGKGGNDDLKGGRGDDKIFAGDGNDLIDGGRGDDTMDGGAGNDIFVADLPSDDDHGHGHHGWPWSLPGNDWHWHGRGPQGWFGRDRHDDGDTYDGGDGVDTLDFSAVSGSVEIDLNDGTTRFGSDTIKNIENLIGGGKGDELAGNDKANVLRGNAGDDELNGEKGNDRLFGGDGKDDLDGGKGDDILVGGKGKDTLTGGDGIDKFVFNSLDDARDVIRDFDKTGSDKDQIVLAQTMFTGFAGDDGADLVAGGFVRARSISGGKTEIQVDVDGGGNSWQSLAEVSTQLTSAQLAAQVVLVQDPIV